MIYKFINLEPSKRVLIQEILIISSGLTLILLDPEKWLFYSFSKIFGVSLIFFSLILHKYSEKTLKQAHSKLQDINQLVFEGIYSNIRHPIYTSLILMEFGMAFVFNSIWVFILVFASGYLHVLTCFNEERLLTEKFGHRYTEYMERVPSRLIPFIF